MDVVISLIADITPVLLALVEIFKFDPHTCWHIVALNAHDGMNNLMFLTGATVLVIITSHAPPLKWRIAIQWSASEIA